MFGPGGIGCQAKGAGDTEAEADVVAVLVGELEGLWLAETDAVTVAELEGLWLAEADVVAVAEVEELPEAVALEEKLPLGDGSALAEVLGLVETEKDAE